MTDPSLSNKICISNTINLEIFIPLLASNIFAIVVARNPVLQWSLESPCTERWDNKSHRFFGIAFY